ncbi:MAG: hypothetical protein AB1529_03720 [Candidatus Micrarchaeota archaeon]
MQADQKKPRLLISEKDIDRVEKETLELVIRILPEIEKSLASWDGLKHKPPALKKKFDTYRKLHGDLSAWARKMLVPSGKAGSFDERVDRMWAFISVSRAIKKVD